MARGDLRVFDLSRLDDLRFDLRIDRQAWPALAMSSTLAGNLIVVENARRAGTELGFLEYLKVGVPLTVLTTLVGVAWLALVQY